MTQTRYRLTGRIEAGELAELYQAVRDDRDEVDIKLFHPRTSDARYARVIAETVNRLSGLKDESVARVLDIGLVRGRLAIVRERVEGYTLGQALQRLLTKEVLMPPALGLYVVIQLLEAVQRAHDAGAIHGAITPGNVLLGKDGRVAVADFGALAALQAVPELKAFAGRGRGAYRAQEVTEGEAPTVQSDVYSLGAIAYELLTLREAVRSAKSVSTRHQPLPPPSRLDRRINGRLDPIIMRAIEPSPQRRFRSCAEFAGALRNFLSTSGGMPSRAELTRLVADLFPNEVQLQLGREVPFADAFTLSEVTGAALAPGVPVKALLTARPSFSGGELPAYDDDRSGAETIEGLPAFEEYDGTQPGKAGPLEQGWEAPPGAPPPKRKSPALGAGGPAPSAISPALKSRFRVVEDFSRDPDEDAPREAEVETRPEPKPPPRPPEPVPKTERTDLSPPPQSEVNPIPSDERIPLVRDTSGRQRRMITEEVNLWRKAVQRRRFALVALGFALVGLVCLGLVLWRFGRKVPVDGGDRRRPRAAVSGDSASATPAQPPAAERALPVPVETDPRPVRIDPEPEPKAAERDTPERASFAYLTIRSNLPARVYIDGKKLPRTTPLKRYKVEAGTRTIVLEAVRTGERKTFSAKLVKHKESKFYERFEIPPR
ncbi:MAG: serine/threonine protein kinase [Myxococcaceae bacterium]|nr:serine/threonine protein kinase [Myxococcaceae bacterium]